MRSFLSSLSASTHGKQEELYTVGPPPLETLDKVRIFFSGISGAVGDHGVKCVGYALLGYGLYKSPPYVLAALKATMGASMYLWGQQMIADSDRHPEAHSSFPQTGRRYIAGSGVIGDFLAKEKFTFARSTIELEEERRVAAVVRREQFDYLISIRGRFVAVSAASGDDTYEDFIDSAMVQLGDVRKMSRGELLILLTRLGHGFVKQRDLNPQQRRILLACCREAADTHVPLPFSR